MNKIIKKLHKTLFSLACTSFAISIFSFSAGANVMAERDLLLNSSFVSSDHILNRVNLSAAAILSGETKPGFFVQFDALTNLHNLGKDINIGAFLYYVHQEKTPPVSNNDKLALSPYIKFNFTNNFYLGATFGLMVDNYTLIKYEDDANNSRAQDTCTLIGRLFKNSIYGKQTLIFCANKISIAENTNLFTELSFGRLDNSTKNFLLFNLNIGLDFKIEGFNVETRLSDFISVEEHTDKYYIGTPAFTISTTDTFWAFLSFGAKTNLNFEAKNIMGFVQATVKL